MAQPTIETAPVSDYARLVTFEWGNTPSAIRYTDYTSDLTVSSNTHTSLTSLAIEFGKLTVGTEDDETTIMMPASAAPADRLSRLPFRGEVAVTIQDVAPSDLPNPRTLWRGLYDRAIRNFEENPEDVQLVCKPLKSRLKRQVGLVASRTDNFWLGHPANGVNIAAKQLTGTVTDIGTNSVRTRITVSIGGSPDLSDSLWRNGYIEALGERIAIRKSLTDGRFNMSGVVDQDWLDQTVTLTPGWDGELSTARSVYSADDLESRFCAPGYTMLDRNPVFQTGGQS